MASTQPPAHHVQAPLCTTRALYRRGRRLTAVKVYSVCAESAHVLVAGVPALDLRRELRALLVRHGRLLHLRCTEQHLADYTETYHARYHDVRAATAAKRTIDTLNWYGGSLHVCYAPELETLAETRLKLEQRRRQVVARLRLLTHSHAQHEHASSTGPSEYCSSSTALKREAAGTSGSFEAAGKRRRITNVVVLPPPPPAPCFLPPSASPLPRSASPLPRSASPLSRSASGLQPSAETVETLPATGPVVVRSVAHSPVNKISFHLKRP